MRQLTLLLAVLTCCEHALAMGGGHGTKLVTLSDSHLTDLANRPGRVGGYWVNSNDWFYFAGDTKALNDFLRRYAELKETPLVLVIHPGKAPAETCVGDLFADVLGRLQGAIGLARADHDAATGETKAQGQSEALIAGPTQDCDRVVEIGSGHGAAH